MGKNADKKRARQGDYTAYLDKLRRTSAPESMIRDWCQSMRAALVGQIVAGTEFQAPYESAMRSIMAQSAPDSIRREYVDTIGAHLAGAGAELQHGRKLGEFHKPPARVQAAPIPRHYSKGTGGHAKPTKGRTSQTGPTSGVEYVPAMPAARINWQSGGDID